MIHVTKIYLPPLAEYTAYLGGIWERGWVTNYRLLVQELEEKPKVYLGVKHLSSHLMAQIAAVIIKCL